VSNSNSISAVSYSVGSPDLRLPDRPTHFEATPQYYSGSSSNGGGTSVSFSSATPESLGIGGGSYGTNAPGIFSSDALRQQLQGKLPSTPARTAPSGTSTTTVSQNAAPIKNQSAAPGSTTASAIAPFVFSGTGFTPVSPTFYRPDARTTVSTTQAGPARSVALSQSGGSSANLFTSSFRPTVSSLVSYAPATGSLANGLGRGTAPAAATSRPLSGMQSYTLKASNQEFKEWKSGLTAERIESFLPSTGVSVSSNGSQVSNTSASDQDALLKLSYLGRRPGPAGEVMRDKYNEFRARLELDYSRGDAISKNMVSESRRDVKVLLGSVFGAETSGSAATRPPAAPSRNFFSNFNTGLYGSAAQKANVTFSTPRSALPQLSFQAPAGGSAFTRLLNVAPQDTNYFRAQGRAMNLLGGMPAVEPRAQDRIFAELTGQSQITRTAALQAIDNKVLGTFGKYVPANRLQQLKADTNESVLFLDDKSYRRASGMSAGQLKSNLAVQIDSPMGPFRYINASVSGADNTNSSLSHEKMHTLESPEYDAAVRRNPALSAIREGVTERFNAQAGYGSGSYGSQVSFVDKSLAPLVGEEVLRKAYFGGDAASIKQIEQALATLPTPK
jgi:hypothetical protein